MYLEFMGAVAKTFLIMHCIMNCIKIIIFANVCVCVCACEYAQNHYDCTIAEQFKSVM